MKTKVLFAAAATALTLSAATLPAIGTAQAADTLTVTMTRIEAKKAVLDYFQKRGEKVRIRRSWQRDNMFYAKVVTRFNDPVGTVSVDLETGKVALKRR